MCGIFGYVSLEGDPVNLRTLENIALGNESRGDDAWGMSWINGDGRMQMYKQTGPISQSIHLLGMAKDARLLVGHVRMATHGTHTNNLNNHPHPCDGGWIVHNGVIRQHLMLSWTHRLHTHTDCDSEVVGLLIEKQKGKLLQRCKDAIKLIPGCSPFAMLGLWKPGSLVFAKRGNPLNIGDAEEGTYMASLRQGLPGRVKDVTDNQVYEYKLEEFTNEPVGKQSARLSQSKRVKP